MPRGREPAAEALGNALVLRHMRGQREVPYLPPARWQALRDARVRAIVRHAAATVPHYRDLFLTGRIDPGDIRTAADLDRLPLVTSGSTRRPLTVYHDHAWLLANIAYGERERAVSPRHAGRTGLCAAHRRSPSGVPFGDSTCPGLASSGRSSLRHAHASDENVRGPHGDSRLGRALMDAGDGFECRFLATPEARHFASQLDGSLARLLPQAMAAGDAAYAILEGDPLASIGLYAASPTPLLDNLVVYFQAPARYM